MSENKSVSVEEGNALIPFKSFQKLFIPTDIKILKKEKNILEKEAMDWFKKYFNPVFGSTTNCNTKEVVTYYCAGSLLHFGFPNLGDYHYKFILRMIHFELWQTKEWKEGFKYGKFCMKSDMPLSNDNYRDANPYTDIDFYRSSAWDCGYIMGLSNFSFIKWYNQIKQS